MATTPRSETTTAGRVLGSEELWARLQVEQERNDGLAASLAKAVIRADKAEAELEQLRRLHEVATERTVTLAAEVERLQGDRVQAAADGVLPVNLAEHAKVKWAVRVTFDDTMHVIYPQRDRHCAELFVATPPAWFGKNGETGMEVVSHIVAETEWEVAS
ncbi:hypothetical protein ABIQ69_11405 [Agromyces sp. G08B096]|uniref:Uncharacterized protein n=1 Tax=Agromyces sp. G08B096 TaxID=3156399 RepID=A0AAU7W4F7_9MICO